MTDGSSASVGCVECRHAFPPADGLSVEGEFFCRPCWRTLAGIPAVEAGEADAGAPPTGADDIPWRRISEIGLFHAFLATIWAVFRHTTRFFSCIHNNERPMRPILFVLALLLFIVPGSILNSSIMLWSVALLSQHDETVRAEMQPMIETFFVEEDGQLRLNRRVQLFQMFVIPIQFLAMNVIVASLVQQIILAMLRGPESGGYAVTLQVRCYSLTGQLFVVLPIIGLLAAPLVSLALNIRGLQVSQRLPIGQALLAGAAPFCIHFMLQFILVAMRLVSLA